MSKTLKKIRPEIIPPYKIAKPYIGPHESHVFYSYYSKLEKRYKRDKIRVGVRGLTPEKKLALLSDVASELNRELRDLNKQGVYRDETPQALEELDLRTMTDWLTYASTDQKNSEELRKTFSKLIFNLNKFLAANKLLSHVTPWDWNAESIIMERFVGFLKDKELAGKTINDLIYGVDKLNEYLAKKKIIRAQQSYADLRIDHAKNETNKYLPLTHNEKVRVFDYYRERYPDYYLYLLSVYYTCIRPGELHRLQVKNFNMEARTLFVPWFASKNGLSQYVQILEPYFAALVEFGIRNLPKDWFLFGAKCIPAVEQFLAEDYSTKHWFRHAKKIDLPKGKTAYGLKHTFNIDYVENNKRNIDWEFLRRHNRHATVQQTQDYISGLTAYFLDETKSVILNYHR